MQLLESGCCGMAGAYGMMRDKYELSVAVAEPLVEKIKALPAETRVVASGMSCRHQIRDLAGVRALHMAEWLAMSLSPERIMLSPMKAPAVAGSSRPGGPWDFLGLSGRKQV